MAKKWNGKYMKQKVRVRRGRVRQYTNERTEEALTMEESKAEFPEVGVQNFWKAKKTWAELGLRPELMQGIQDAGYDHPSKIQSYGIALINTEPYETLVAQGHTGTGKTATFVIGSLQRIDLSEPKTQVLAIAHTRELVRQIYDEFLKIGKHMEGLNMTVHLPREKDSNKQAGQVAVVTPAYLEKIARNLDFTKLKIFIIDEADHMLSADNTSNAINAINLVKPRLPADTQFLLLSATFNEKDLSNIANIGQTFKEITIEKSQLALPNIKQYYVSCPHDQKVDKLVEIIQAVPTNKLTIVFVNTCRFAAAVSGMIKEKLDNALYKTALLIGRNMTFNERDLTIDDLKAGKFNVLITTNLLARGYDNTLSTVVINFDFPSIFDKEVKPEQRDIDVDVYLHRIGRCGRFARNGFAFTIITDEDAGNRNIESLHTVYGVPIAKVEDLTALSQEITAKTESEGRLD